MDDQLELKLLNKKNKKSINPKVIFNKILYLLGSSLGVVVGAMLGTLET